METEREMAARLTKEELVELLMVRIGIYEERRVVLSSSFFYLAMRNKAGFVFSERVYGNFDICI